MSSKFDYPMLDVAYTFAKLSYCVKRQVGAVITFDNRIISTGFNGTVNDAENVCEDKILTCSACKEESIIQDADIKISGLAVSFTCIKCDRVITDSLAHLDKYVKTTSKDNVVHAEQNALMFAVRRGISLKDATLYCTLMPCSHCAKLIVQSGITKVVYSESYKDTKGLDILHSSDIEVIQLDHV